MLYEEQSWTFQPEQHRASKQHDIPNGVPVVSDESMGQFMAAVYEDQVMPTNLTGVPVTVYVTDANGNFRQIGETTTDASGMFSLTWMPDIEGDYTVVAKFAGTQGYFGASAQSTFTAIAPAPTATPVAPVDSVADQYFVPAIAGLFVAIIVVGLVIILLMLRKH